MSGVLDGGNDIKINGYEIHQGISATDRGKNNIVLGNEKDIKGAVKNNIIGTYIHGVFDNNEFTNFISSIVILPDALYDDVPSLFSNLLENWSFGFPPS